MAETLSFTQVRGIGVVAWHGNGYLYVDGQLLRVVCDALDPDKSALQPVRVSALQGNEDIIRTGWQHLERCQCECCRNRRTSE